MKHKLIALLLAGTMAMTTLAGCGQEEKESTESANKSSEEKTQEQSSAEESAEEPEDSNFNPTGYPIVDEKITLDVWVAVRDNEPHPITDISEIPGIKELEELTNIHLNSTIVYTSEWDTKTNLMFASGEYPDLLFTGWAGLDEESLGVEQGILIPVDEYMTEEYMPNYVGRIVDQGDFSTGIENLVRTDGKTYAFPFLNSTGIFMKYFYYINQTWLDALELDHPSTLEELTDVFRAFRDQDPNGNGEADEIPLMVGLNTNLFDFNTMLAMFNVPTSGLFVDDETGKVCYGAQEEGFREFFEWLHLCYEEGLCDPEIISMDQSVATAKLCADQVGFIPAWRRLAMGWGEAEEDLALWIPDKAKFQNVGSGSAVSAVVITSQNEYVKETVRYLDAMLDEEVQWDLLRGPYAEGEVATEYPCGWTYKDGKVLSIGAAEIMEKQNYVLNQAGFFYAPSKYYEETVYEAPNAVERRADFYAYYDAGLIDTIPSTVLNFNFEAEIREKLNLIITDLEAAMAEAKADFILNGVTDESWNAYVSRLKDIGIEEYIDIYQTAYDNAE